MTAPAKGDAIMRSMMNRNRFLPSIKQWVYGTPRPGKVQVSRLVAQVFRPFPAKRVIRKRMFFIPKSRP